MVNKTFFGAAGALLLVAGSLAAQPGYGRMGRGPGGFGGHGVEMMADRLGLTDAQQQQTKAIFEAARTQSEPIHQQLRAAHEQLQAGVQGGKSEAELRVIANQIGDRQGDLALIHAQAMGKFYALLTPEQKAKAAEMRQKMQQRMEQRHSRQ